MREYISKPVYLENQSNIKISLSENLSKRFTLSTEQEVLHWCKQESLAMLLVVYKLIRTPTEL